MQEMHESRIWFLAQEDPLEKETATDSSILRGIIPWTEEPDTVHGVAKSQLSTHTHTHGPNSVAQGQEWRLLSGFQVTSGHRTAGWWVWSQGEPSKRTCPLVTPSLTVPSPVSIAHWIRLCMISMVLHLHLSLLSPSYPRSGHITPPTFQTHSVVFYLQALPAQLHL